MIWCFMITEEGVIRTKFFFRSRCLCVFCPVSPPPNTRRSGENFISRLYRLEFVLCKVTWNVNRNCLRTGDRGQRTEDKKPGTK